MAKQEKKDKPVDPFEGFQAITEQIVPGIKIENQLSIEDSGEDIDDINDIEEEIEIPSKTKSKKTDISIEDEEDEEEIDEDEEEEIIPIKKSKKEVEDEIEETISNKSKSTDSEEIDETELVTPFVDLFTEELGWELDDEDKPKSVKELVDYMGEIISSNSKPTYSSEIVERFDKFIANGGDPSKFMEINFSETDYTKIDITKEENQKRVIRDFYKQKGFSEQKIDKYVERIIDNDEIEEEAKDALDELKTVQEEKRSKLEKQQEISRKQQIQEHQMFINSTEKYVGSITDINGIKLSKKEKDEILPYIFSVQKDGKTQQQKDYEANPIEYLVATAYFYKYKNDLKKKLENTSLTSATEKFKKKQLELKNKQSKTKSNVPENDIDDGEDWLTALTKPINKLK